jgi:hypothetical protein
MTIPEPGLPVPTRRPQGIGGCLAGLLVLVGIVLLLPGLCSLVFMFAGVGADGGIAILWLISFAIGAGAIALIRYAIRNR